MNCINCDEAIPEEARDCPACGRDCGFPNVRKASLSAEQAKLQLRWDAAIVSARNRGCEKILESFGEAVKASKALITMPLATLADLMSDVEKTYVSFQKKVSAGIQRPRRNEFDSVRLQYENALFPYYAPQIIFAALALDELELPGYGSHFIILKDAMIAHRATVFEENPHVFVEKHKILLNKPIPPGFRAIWDERHKLAIAKLHSQIDASMEATAFPAILLTRGSGSADGDWIEVHIYGSITSSAIEKVGGPIPKTKADRVVWEDLQEKRVK